MRIRNWDLLLIEISVLALAAVVILAPSLVALRVALGIPAVLFFPGYCLLAALFPAKDGLPPVERVSLAFALSIAVVPMVGMALNYSPWGIRLDPILASLALLITLLSSLAYWRRRATPADQEFAFAVSVAPANLRHYPLRWLFAGSVALAAAGLFAAMYFAATSGNQGGKSTEFYVLGTGGEATSYPREGSVGEEMALLLRIVNHESRTVRYRIMIEAEGEKLAGKDKIELGDERTWEEEVRFTPKTEGQRQAIDLLLFKDTESDVYRSLRLWIDVKSSPLASTSAGAAIIPSSGASPTPAAGPTPAPTATPGPTQEPSLPTPGASRVASTTHLVMPGETLDQIATIYGIPAGVLATFNHLENPDLIYSGQTLLIPDVSP